MDDPHVYYHNLKPNADIAPYLGWIREMPTTISFGGSGGPIEAKTDSQGNLSCKLNPYQPYWVPAVPGTFVITPGFQYLREPSEGEEDGPYDGYYYPVGDEQTLMGSTFRITVENPVITTNAPASGIVGSAVSLTTALTNTSITNKKVGIYAEALTHEKDPDFYGITSLSSFQAFFDETELGKLTPKERTKKTYDIFLAYQPKVEIVEGKDLVRQSSQDYSNTMSTSETLTFLKAGTLKLKVTYHQINTDGSMCFSWVDNKQVYKDQRYHPEKIITIQVTEDGIAPTQNQPHSLSTSPATALNNSAATQSAFTGSETDGSKITAGTSDEMKKKETVNPNVDDQPMILTDEQTGIKIGTQEGVIPAGTVLVVSPADMILDNSDGRIGKFLAFDISLQNSDVKIQPNGKVSVSIPIPVGYDEEHLTIYAIDDSGTKEELPSNIEGDRITFETDHFSIYAVAEKMVPKKGASAFWVVLPITLIVLLTSGVGIAIWWFKFRNKQPNNS